MKRLLALFIAVTSVASLSLVLSTTPADAATTVNETADELNADGDCSLREAVEALNSGAPVDSCAAAADHIISLPAGTYDIDDNLDVDVDTTLRGAGSTTTSLSCGPAIVNACIRLIQPDVDFEVEGLALEDAPDGGIQSFSEKPVRITDSIIQRSATFGVDGGLSDVILTGSLVRDNGTAGILTSVADVRVDHSVVGMNVGAAVAVGNGEVVVSASTISGNSVGIHADLGHVSVDHSLIKNNGASAIDTDAADVTVVNSTLTGNLLHGINTDSGDIEVGSSTIADNAFRAFNYTGDGSIYVRNSILANDAEECDNPMTSGGHNITNDNDVSCFFDQPTDRTDVDPELGLLANNGGPTQSYLPQAGSLAIDEGGDCPDDDQRGQSRPADGDDDGEALCDIGAVEVQGDDPAGAAEVQPASAASAVPAVPRFTG